VAIRAEKRKREVLEANANELEAKVRDLEKNLAKQTLLWEKGIAKEKKQMN
jgi:hypothetical protein